MAATRSFLFAPANRTELYARLANSGADIVCLDLEDAVPPDEKEMSRDPALQWLGAGPRVGPARAVRLNPLSTRAGLADLHAASAASLTPGTLLALPKVDDPHELRLADAVLTETGSRAGLMALIESAAGLENAAVIASATPRLRLLLFGAADLAAELGIEIAPEPLLYARARVVHAARTAGIPVIDVPSLNFRDIDAVEREARAARALGFAGKGAIHPSNIAPINAIFSPSPGEIAKAKEIIAAHEASPTGLAVIDGKLIEGPVLRSMRATLVAARAAGLE